VIKEGDFSRRHTNSSDEVSDEESKASVKFLCTSATMDTKKVVFTMKATYQCTLHGLVIQILISLCLICGKQLTNAAIAPEKLK
jgi:hypothetical protein